MALPAPRPPPNRMASADASLSNKRSAGILQTKKKISWHSKQKKRLAGIPQTKQKDQLAFYKQKKDQLVFYKQKKDQLAFYTLSKETNTTVLNG